MKMKKRYGIFECEVDDLIGKVRGNAPQSEIENSPCPCCGAKLKVSFYPDGKGFTIDCLGTPPHKSMYQEIEKPPFWWKDRIGEVTEWISS